MYQQWRSQGKQGVAALPPPPMMKIWCSRKAQIYNRMETLEGSFKIVSATALFYLEKGVSVYSKGRFLVFKGVVKKSFPGGSTL